jgi:hypothetical protein
MFLLLSFALTMSVPQSDDWPRVYPSGASVWLLDEGWFEELDATELQMSKLRVWNNHQKAARQKAKRLRVALQGEEQRLGDDVENLRIELKEHHRKMRAVDEKTLRQILTDEQVKRFIQLCHWKTEDYIVKKNAAISMSLLPLKHFTKAEMAKLSEARIEFQSEENKAVEHHEHDLKMILQRLVTEESYQQVLEGGYRGIRLKTPMHSIAALEFFANECRHPSDQVEKLNRVLQDAQTGLENLPAGASIQMRRELEKKVLKGVYETVDEMVIEAKFNRLSCQFLRISLNEFAEGGMLNADAAAYFGLDSDEVVRAQKEMLTCKEAFNETYAQLQLRQVEKFRSQLTRETLGRMDKILGDPPRFKMKYYQNINSPSLN